MWVTNSTYYHPPIVEVWSLESGLRPAGPPLTIVPEASWYGSVFAVTPDGDTIAIATHYGLFGVDWKAQKLLWQAAALDHRHYYGKSIAIGDKGKTLYTAGAHVIDRWNLADGQKLGSLGTNELIVKFLRTSRDGSVLVAGFGKINQSATSFALWESGKDEPVFRFSNPSTYGASVGISTDGQMLALNHWPDNKLEVWDWRKGKKTVVPLRVPYAAHSAYSLLWSPDGKHLAAYVDTYHHGSIVVYETMNWKPLAHWPCAQMGSSSDFFFYKDGSLLQMHGAEIDALNVTSLKGLAD